ncbi:MAG: phage shock protein C [Sphingobacteriales bacterium]|jgi:phage shock protein C
MEKQLYRSKINKQLFGVCAGLADYFKLDTIWVRLGFVCATIFGGTGVVLYLILALVLPEASSGNPEFNTQPENAKEMTKNKKDSGSLIGGLVMVTLGLCFLAQEYIPHVNFQKLWPLILVVIGIGLLIKAKKEGKDESSPEN